MSKEMIPVRVEFTAADKQTPVWAKFVEYQKQRLEILRTQNEGDRTPEETAKLRGRIAEIRTFLVNEKEKPVVG